VPVLARTPVARTRRVIDIKLVANGVFSLVLLARERFFSVTPYFLRFRGWNVDAIK
jgi:hypothetical protein